MVLVAVILLISLLSVLGAGFFYWNKYNSPASKRLRRSVLGERQVEYGTQSQFKITSQILRKQISPLARFAMQEEVKKTEQLSSLDKQFLAAGFRAPSTRMVFFAFKTMLTFGLPLLGLAIALLAAPFLDAGRISYLMFILAALGYFSPSLWLSSRVKQRRQELYENFPDALDLLRTCVEAGLATDAAIARVGDEMRIRSRALSDEFRQVVLEQRAGSARNVALANMAERVGITDVESMVASLIQSERFGTSIAESLRVYSENLRLDRKLKAEEQAAKIPTKILLPLIVCIFPLLFILILAPPISNVMKSFHS